MWLRKRLANFFILRASTLPVEDPQPATRVWFDTSVGRIECFATRKSRLQHESVPLETDASPDLLILKLPGTAGRAERSTPFPSQAFPDWETEVWTWNPPGYGASQGTASLCAIPPAVIDVWDELVSRRCGPQTRTLVIGNSLGAATALYLGSQRDLSGLMLRNPPPLVDLVRAGDAWWNAHRGGSWIAASIADEMNATVTAAQCKVPAVFIRSANDTLVWPQLQQVIFDAYAGFKELLEIEGAEHHTPLDDDDALRVCSMLRSTLGYEGSP